MSDDAIQELLDSCDCPGDIIQRAQAQHTAHRDKVAALRSSLQGRAVEVERLRAELWELRAHELAVAEAVGLYQDDGHQHHAEPPDQVLGAVRADHRRVDRIIELISQHGCSCECGHSHEEHIVEGEQQEGEEPCERCLACRVNEALLAGADERGESAEMAVMRERFEKSERDSAALAGRLRSEKAELRTRAEKAERERDEARAEVTKLRRELFALRAFELAVAGTVGILFQVDGHNAAPGPRDMTLAAVRDLSARAKRSEWERDEARAELEAERAKCDGSRWIDLWRVSDEDLRRVLRDAAYWAPEIAPARLRAWLLEKCGGAR